MNGQSEKTYTNKHVDLLLIGQFLSHLVRTTKTNKKNSLNPKPTKCSLTVKILKHIVILSK